MLTEVLRERFFDKINKSSDDSCWIWEGCRDSDGYGNFFLGDLEGYPRLAKAHRVSYAQHKGPFDQELLVCHHCDNPWCVNPDHLFLGTNQDNCDDKIRKGRNKCSVQVGSQNNASKLSEEDVLEIVGFLPTFNNKEISKKFSGKVSHQQVSLIRRGKSWSHVTGITPETSEKYASLRKS